jgi:hypothetical protein
VPETDCQPAAPTTGRLRIANGKLVWEWTSSAAVAVTDFGDPTTVTSYLLCLYDAAGGMLGAEALADQRCGTRACWKPLGRSRFRFRDKDGADGLTSMLLRAAGPREGKIEVKAGGINFSAPGLPLHTPFRVQVRQSSSAACWDATFSTAIRNTATEFAAKSD